MTRRPRPTARDARGVPHIHMAEDDAHAAARDVAVYEAIPEWAPADGEVWNIGTALDHLTQVDGPRSVRVRAMRLARRLGRLLARMARVSV